MPLQADFPVVVVVVVVVVPLVEAPGAPRVAAMQTRNKVPMIIAFAIFKPD